MAKEIFAFQQITKTKRRITILISLFIIIYTLLTLTPFYFLFVRSFVPTTLVGKLWLWMPPKTEANINARLIDYASQFNIDMEQFKKNFNIKGYLDLNLTLNDVSKKYNVNIAKLKKYFKPYVNYSGWMLIIKSSRYIRSLLATIWVVVSSILIGAFLSAATGSVLARFRKRFHMVVYQIYLLQIIIPPIMIIIPLYIIIAKYLNLANTYMSLILLYIKGGALSTVLFTSYISSIPIELKESVYIDGGSRIIYFFKVLLPLIKPAFAAYIAITVPTLWNDLLQGLVFLNPDKYTIIPLVSSIAGKFTTNDQAIYSGLLLSVLPLVLLYLIFNKLFIKSQLMGALKE